MGVPAFYRWISEKYGKIVEEMLEKRPAVVNGTVIPLDLTEPNPNGMEFDNLYVDMNGLIHPCSHPEDREAPSSEVEMYANVTKYVDRLVAAIRPRRVLYLAIDGVAPRAKMNQQRSRRFRTAQEMKEKKEMKMQVLAEMASSGFQVPNPAEDHSSEWDSNVITPGTEFMCNLSMYLRHYVVEKMNKDPFWRGIQVIISDASEPGEGEHKIMNFIRTQRAQAGYDPNTKHVLHGLDADLIMLALASHEPHFTILREKVFFGKKDKEQPAISDAQKLLNAQSMREGALVSSVHPEDEWVYSKPLQALHISILREYLDNEFSCLRQALPFPYDLERIIDDFIFLCFFVGNDFLPHLPSLDIRDGALDFLIECYKEVLPSLGNYLTSPGGQINLFQADVILSKVGEIEDQIFLRKKRADDEMQRRMGRRKPNDRRESGGAANSARDSTPQPPPPPPPRPVRDEETATEIPPSKRSKTLSGSSTPAKEADQPPTVVQGNVANAQAASRLRDSLLGKRKQADLSDGSDADRQINQLQEKGGETEEAEKAGMATESPIAPSPLATPADGETGEDSTAVEEDVIQREGDAVESTEQSWDTEEEEAVAEVVQEVVAANELSAEALELAKEELKKRLKMKEDALFDQYKETVKDDVKLHESGWKDRYYGEKFKKEDIEAGGGLRRMCVSYVQGLCWVLQYYYQGVPSWNWYYPFHYAPFASDLVNIDTYGDLSTFTKSQPFHPLQQLLAVLPATSAPALPAECRWLMTAPHSPIVDLYNDDIPIDPNGKHLPWLWILLIPFIDESRILDAFQLCRKDLTLSGRRRNAFGNSVLFVHASHPLGQALQGDPQAAAILQGCASEKDPDVLELLQQQKPDREEGEGGSLGGDPPAASGDVPPPCQTLSCPPDSFEISYLEGHGLAGTLSKPPFQWYVPMGSAVTAPADGERWFSSIAHNQVRCLQFDDPPMLSVHQSVLLQGFRAPKSKLSQSDLIARRPPRLNRSGFSMLDIMHEQQQRQGRGNGGNWGAGTMRQGRGDRGMSHSHHSNPNSIYHLQQQYQSSSRPFPQHNYQQQHHQQTVSVGSYFSASQSMSRQVDSLGRGMYNQQQQQSYAPYPVHATYEQQMQYQQYHQQQQQSGYYPPEPASRGTGGNYSHRVETISDVKRMAAANFSNPSYNLFQQPAHVGHMSTRDGPQHNRARGTMFVNLPNTTGHSNQGYGAAPRAARETVAQGASMEALRMQLLQTVQSNRPQGPPMAQAPGAGQPRGHSFNSRSHGGDRRYG